MVAVKSDFTFATANADFNLPLSMDICKMRHFNRPELHRDSSLTLWQVPIKVSIPTMWIEVCLHVHVSEAKTSNTSQDIRKIQFEDNVKRIANLIFNWHIIDFLLLPYLTRNNLCEKIFHENLSGRTFTTKI